jgi:hypothetical protein
MNAEAAMADALLTSPLPADVGQAIRTVKAQLRRQIGDVAAVFAEADAAIRAEAAAVAADREAGRPVWPVVQFRDIAAGTVPAGAVAAIRRRGCVVVRDTGTPWWHADVIHSVGEVSGQRGWGNVMYIPAAPYCEKNAAYARVCGQAFLTGASPGDFAAEDYETTWAGRATPADLNDTGRKQLGLQPW